MTKEQYFESPVRGILINENGCKVVKTDDPKNLLNANDLETPALKIGREGRFYGCICDSDARTSGKYDDDMDTVIIHKKRFLDKIRFYGYVCGPVFIYLNKGLSDDDLDYIQRYIFTTNKGTTHLIAENFINYCYEVTDP